MFRPGAAKKSLHVNALFTLFFFLYNRIIELDRGFKSIQLYILPITLSVAKRNSTATLTIDLKYKQVKEDQYYLF